MKNTFTFSEINYGRIEIESAIKPDNDDIIGQILEGKADYNDTEFADFCLIAVDGKTQSGELQETAALMHEAGVCPKCESYNIEYGGGEVEDSSYIYKWVCEDCGVHGRECYDMVFSEHIIDGEG